MNRIADEILSLEALILSRTYLYTLFHKALGGEPCDRLFEMLADDQTIAMIDEYAGADRAMAELRDYFSGFAEFADDEFVEAAKDEYTRVFVGPNRLLALPWESPYVSHEPVLFHKSTLAVRNAYHAHGWQLKRHLHVPDDHVSLLCAFMARLASESLQAFEENRLADIRAQMVEQKMFIDEHLNNWLPEYAQGLRRSEKAPFYCWLVEGLASFARLDSVFAIESIGWIDEQGSAAGGSCSEQLDVADTLSRGRTYFEAAKEALDRLKTLELKNLEDNELCDIG